LDTYHLGQEAGLIERIASFAAQVALVQLGDAKKPPVGEQNRCRLNNGIVPNREIVAALKAAGYDGYYDIELLGEEFEAADYGSLLRHAREIFDSLFSQ
jgi:sugar phosphate isomerase/epimerase